MLIINVLLLTLFVSIVIAQETDEPQAASEEPTDVPDTPLLNAQLLPSASILDSMAIIQEPDELQPEDALKEAATQIKIAETGWEACMTNNEELVARHQRIERTYADMLKVRDDEIAFLRSRMDEISRAVAILAVRFSERIAPLLPKTQEGDTQ